MRIWSRRTVLVGTLGISVGAFGKDKKKGKKDAPVGLLAGTVFHSGGVSFPGVAVTVYALEDGKSHWKGVTDRRGEYAMRVPATVEGVKYRVVAEAKGFETLEHEVYAYEAQRTGQNFMLKTAD
jgi:hypothetical protein